MSNKNLNCKLETIRNNRNELMQVCLFLESKGLECRESSLGMERVKYYRGRDLKTLFEENKFEIAEMIDQKIKRDIGPKGNRSIENLYEMYIKKNLYKLFI
jgi:hypothetical protein